MNASIDIAKILLFVKLEKGITTRCVARCPLRGVDHEVLFRIHSFAHPVGVYGDSRGVFTRHVQTLVKVDPPDTKD